MIKKAVMSTYKDEILVKVVSLDKFLENKPFPDLIRMDVEGYEIEIIRGMKKILESNKPLKIFVEIHPNIMKEKIKNFLNILKNFGFQAKKVTHEPYSFLLNEPIFVKKIFSIVNQRMEFKFGYLNLDILI